MLSPDRLLGLGEVVLLVMGGTIGADIYVASALGAPLGSSSLFVWGAAAAMAMAVIMAFAVCALAVPDTGGPYLYVRRAFGPLAGFMAGWAVLVAQWAALAALPVAFSQYLQALVHDASWATWCGPASRLLFLLAVTTAVGRGPLLATFVTDLLTLARLVPLLLVVLGGLTWAALHPASALDHLLPLEPPSLAKGGSLLVPVFWAYAGFEVGSIPAGQVKDPRRTIPIGLTLGMAAASAIYLLVNLTTVLVVAPAELASSTAPLVSCARDAATGLMPFCPRAPVAAELLLGTGVLVSTLGTATAVAFGATHLVAAMASTGLLPPVLGRVHPRLGTAVAALAALVVPAALASTMTGLLSIVSTAVVCSVFAYLATALAAWRLSRSPAGRVAAGLAAAVCLLLLSLTELRATAAGAALLATGGLLYALRRRVPAPAPETWAETFTAMVALSRATSARGSSLLPPARVPSVEGTPLFAAGIPGSSESPSRPAAGAELVWTARFVPAAAFLVARLRRSRPRGR